MEPLQSTLTGTARRVGIPGWPLRIVACLDDEHSGDAIIAWLMSLPEEPGREVVLVALQPRPDEVRTRAIMSGKIRRHLEDAGRDRTAPVAAAAGAARIEHLEQVALIDGPDCILDCARQEGADLIVMVRKPAGALRRHMSRLPAMSLASRVADLADVPVLILASGARHG